MWISTQTFTTCTLIRRIPNREANFPSFSTNFLTKRLIVPDAWLSFSAFFDKIKMPPPEWISEQRRPAEEEYLRKRVDFRRG
jgi:hypothetical protein